MFDEGETEEENQSNYNASYKVKFIIVGDSCVGKSNILLRFYQNRFDSNKTATIGMEFVSKHYIFFINMLNLFCYIEKNENVSNFNNI